MTSAETDPLAAEAELEDGADPADPEAALWSSPWAPSDQHRRGGNGSGAAPSVPATNPLSPAAPNTSATSPGVGARAPGGTSAAPGQAGTPGSPNGTPAGPGSTGGGAPADEPGPSPVETDRLKRAAADAETGGPPVDTDKLAEMAPMALMAGAGLLPILGSALTGLLGGSGGAAPEGEMSPESQKALEALDLLAEVYGDGPTEDPEVQRLREELGLDNEGSEESGGESSGGSSETARMVKARQLFQKNAATAFNNLDNQLAGYVKRLAGTNSVDKKEVNSLIREVNVALADLGPQAYTKEGQQKVREILTQALRKAHGIVSGGQSNATDTATAIDKLTNQYLYNIAGQEVPEGYMDLAGAAGGSEKARKAVEVAMAQIGDPYVWGAEGPDQFDCSGLMQYAAKAAGVDIQRVAADQYQSLPQVAAGDIEPGDLIFPADSFKGDGPGHVQMYIGDGKVVHAPSAGKNVEVTALPSSYKAARWA